MLNYLIMLIFNTVKKKKKSEEEGSRTGHRLCQGGKVKGGAGIWELEFDVWCLQRAIARGYANSICPCLVTI